MNSNEVLSRLIVKIKTNTEKIDDDLREFPGQSDGNYFKNSDNCIKLSHIFNWTQSFFTGMAYWAYLVTKDKALLKWLYGFYDEYYKKVFECPMDTMHDLGFLYSLYSVALYKMTGDPNMKKIGLKAADELAKRFEPHGKYIQAWGRMDGKIPEYVSSELSNDRFFSTNKAFAIVDCMMNLPLLFWASEVTGHPYYKRIATCHADMTLKLFIRQDNSICHAYRFDEKTGIPVGEENSCGYAIGSHWARGTAWAVYGFVIAYDYTKDVKYLDASNRLCEKFLEECGDKMPVWDFRLPPELPGNIDTSAVAILLCAIDEILKHRQNSLLQNASQSLKEQLFTYIDFDGNVNGILKEQNGRNEYTSYGDYFLIELLCRETMNVERIW